MPSSAPATPFELVMFDFDGTLVDSAAAKRWAFFTLFPDTPDHRAVVAEVLRDDPDGSRHAVIPRMIAAMRMKGLAAGVEADCIERYGAAVLAAVAESAEVPGATALLRALHGRCAVYVCSNTPDDALKAQIAERRWTHLLSGVFGYPERKPDVLGRLLRAHGVQPERAAVVGDGVSDEAAARAHRCAFFRITAPGDLVASARGLGVRDV